MSGLDDLLVAIAVHLHERGVAVWAPDGPPVNPAGLPIIQVTHMADDPDLVVALTVTPIGSNPLGVDSDANLQVRTRGLPGDPLGGLSTAHTVQVALDGLNDMNLSGVHVHDIALRGGGSLGFENNDPQRRLRQSFNYVVRYYAPGEHRS